MIKFLSIVICFFILFGTISTQTTVLQCVKSECPILNCKVPIRLEGECCDKCPEDLASKAMLVTHMHEYDYVQLNII